MGSLCLSAVPILRCESFTRLQSQVLIIPTALEVIFSTTLIFTNWYSGRRFLLITAEGWIYFALALLDLLSHTIPAVRDSLGIFRIIDITIGTFLFLPCPWANIVFSCCIFPFLTCLHPLDLSFHAS